MSRHERIAAINAGQMATPTDRMLFGLRPSRPSESFLERPVLSRRGLVTRRLLVCMLLFVAAFAVGFFLPIA
jgi:hypothetical protein